MLHPKKAVSMALKFVVAHDAASSAYGVTEARPKENRCVNP